MLGPMKLMMAFEFGSTAAPEMSVFHALPAGNGRNPFRLPPCPVVMPLHALEFTAPFTIKFTVPELAPPGSGFVTLTAKVPAVGAFPVAVSCDVETKVVASALPASITCDPLTKLLPLTVSEKAPVLIVEGWMPLSEGIGLSTSTITLPVMDESLALTAVTVTEFGFGNAAGAEKTPELLIVPVVALPPVIALTDQVTSLFGAPETVAENDCVSPIRTSAPLGEMLTLEFDATARATAGTAAGPAR